MENCITNYEKLEKHIKKFTYGMKYPNERYDLLNKFGLFNDQLNNIKSGWVQKASQEAGNQLINLFDYNNESNNQGIFVSTSRVGFSLNKLDLRKSDIEHVALEEIGKFNDVYKKLFSLFEDLAFSRFGIYFEFLFEEDDIQYFSKLQLFNLLLGTRKIKDFEEIDQRFSYIVGQKNGSEYNKIIIQFQKVVHNDQNNQQVVKYLLTTDFQQYFKTVKMNSEKDIESFIIDKFNHNVKLFKEHFSGYTSIKEEGK